MSLLCTRSGASVSAQQIRLTFRSIVTRLSLVAVLSVVAAPPSALASDDSQVKEKPARGSDAATTLMIDAAYHVLNGKHDEAEACYRQVLELPGTSKDPRSELRTTFLLAKAMAAQTDRQEEVIELLDDTLTRLRSKMRADNEDVTAAHDLLLGQLFWRAWVLAVRPDADQEDYAKAVSLSERWQKVALEDKESSLWMLAFAKMRNGESEEALKVMKEGIAKGAGEVWPGQWFIMAMIEMANGNEQGARDWHTLGCRWVMVTNHSWAPSMNMRKQSAEVTGLSQAYPPEGVTEEECLESTKRLAAAYPNIPRLLAFEAARLATQKQWKEAIALYRQAEKLSPENFRHAEEQTALLLYSNKNPAARTRACRRLIKGWAEAENASSRTDTVIMVSLVDNAKLDREALLGVVEQAIAEQDDVTAFFKMGHGIALYHCGKYEEALARFAEVVPNPHQARTVRLLLFQAMAHSKLGHLDEAKQLLDKGRQLIAEQLPTPDGPQTVWRERPSEWCMAQLVLQQAEELIQD